MGSAEIQYLATKAEYAATIRKERNASWKEFCNMASAANSCTEIYRLAVGKAYKLHK